MCFDTATVLSIHCRHSMCRRRAPSAAFCACVAYLSLEGSNLLCDSSFQKNCPCEIRNGQTNHGHSRRNACGHLCQAPAPGWAVATRNQRPRRSARSRLLERSTEERPRRPRPPALPLPPSIRRGAKKEPAGEGQAASEGCWCGKCGERREAQALPERQALRHRLAAHLKRRKRGRRRGHSSLTLLGLTVRRRSVCPLTRRFDGG